MQVLAARHRRGMSPLRYFIPRQSREHLAPFQASRAGASPLKSSPVRSSGFAFRSAAASGFSLDTFQAATANSQQPAPSLGGEVWNRSTDVRTRQHFT